MTDAQGMVIAESQGAVRIIRLNYPARRNALSLELRAALIATVEAAMGDDEVRALVLTGNGGAFCAGGDISSMQAITVVGGRERLANLHRLVRLLAAGPKPVVAAVEGYAYGAGMSLALLCDQVVAARDAKFCCSFNKVGLMPDMAALWTVPQRVNAGWAKRLMMLAEEVDGETAHRIGLADQLAEPGQALAEAIRLAERFAATAPVPQAYTKAVLARGPQPLEALLAQEADLQALLFGSEDFAEGRDAFLAKRRPAFRGR
ncbi:MAG TPA: enoyl-CoA hydratase-related protein [Ferrovibrio sp.]|jgi:2-(1,2-epoxy-1,2-dihydrophenyl)acetyl-CoA isomerase|uniref:enoyl-CoA hydratase/isomerase family protein n=1 Tax=Ferrovibrio sp. TaxID=1917215 RepID=UPI002B4AF399|nr:enoyl-CoA hydratase-related protein [Ferrovibrio sp.]HLT77293.1 enoyl-CoA hydratase-related protein [Ferrovibrio sp.]